MTQSCTNCGSPLIAGAAFCRTCGTKVEQPNACRSCGTANAPGATFCANCGNALQSAAQQTQYGTPQRPFQQPAMPIGAASARNKWMLPGIGGVIAAVVIVGVVLMMGGSDGEKKKDEPGKGATQTQAKAVLPPDKVTSTSEDLASTIASLNKSQLNVAALTSAQKPVDAKELDKGLAEVAANSMRVAELANIMSKASSAQATDGPSLKTTSAISQQYEAIAQTSYGQVIDAQNLRTQISQGTVELPAITQTISAYGAQMWNNSVTIQGVNGNPFTVFIQGNAPVQISINLAPAAVQQVTVQFGPSIAGWVATSSTYISWPVYVPLVPVRVFDTYDDALLRTMLTLEGQLDPFFSQRYALARLEQYRRLAALDRVGLFSLTGVTDLVNDRAAQGTYINMAELPSEGYLGVNLYLPSGIAVADRNQFRAGIIPSFPNGNVFAYAAEAGAAGGSTAKGINALYAQSSADGGTVGVFAKVPVLNDKPQGTLSISNVKSGKFKAIDSDFLSKDDKGLFGTTDVTYQVSWNLENISGSVSIICNGKPVGSGASGAVSGSSAIPASAVSGQLSCYALVDGVATSITDAVQVKTDGTDDATKKRWNDKIDANRKTQMQAKDDQQKAVAAKGSLTPPGPLGPLDQGITEAAAASAPPVENAVAPAVTNNNNAPVTNNNTAPVRPANTNPPVTNNNAAPPAPAPPAPAPPAVTNNNPPAQPAVQQPKQRTCAEIIAAGRAFQDSAEGERFRSTCPGLPQAPASCDAISKLSTLQRTNAESAFYVQLCAIQGGTNSCVAGTLIDSGSVPSGAGATKVPMDPKCRYSVCLTGTITGTKSGQSSAFSPATALMRANGQAISSCVTFSGVGGTVTFSCDASKFVGYTFGGAFGYTVTRTGSA